MLKEDSHLTPLTEKGFYLREFSGRSLGFVLGPSASADLDRLLAVREELACNGTRMVFFFSDVSSGEALAPIDWIAGDAGDFAAQVWRGLHRSSSVAVAIGEGRDAGADSGFALRVAQSVLHLGLSKLIWLDGQGGFQRSDGSRLSFVDQEGLSALVDDDLPAERAAFLRACGHLLGAGLPSVSLCALSGLEDELFSYAGSGTLFTSGGYITVRSLGLEDFDAAQSFLLRGVADGYLAKRDRGAIDHVLSSGFGAFVEQRFLAGIGALLIDEEAAAGEIASLYTLTRFAGEGVGGYLVRHALACAREQGLTYVFACTTSERVGSFFERHGFMNVPAEELPPKKWEGYPPERKKKVLCFKHGVV